MEDSIISNEMTGHNSISTRDPQGQAPVSYVLVSSQFNQDHSYLTFTYQEEDDNSSTPEDNQQENITSKTEQSSQIHNTLVTENATALIITENGETVPNAEGGAIGSGSVPVTVGEWLEKTGIFTPVTDSLLDLSKDEDFSKFTIWNNDCKNDAEPQGKIPRLELHESKNAFTPSGLLGDYKGQSNFKTPTLCLNVQDVKPSIMAMRIEEPSDDMSPFVPTNTTTANKSDGAVERDQIDKNFNGDNSLASTIPTEPHQLLQKYLMDPERLLNLRNYFAHDMPLYSAENGQRCGRREVLEELVNLLKNGEQNEIYQLLFMSLKDLRPTEKAVTFNSINDEFHDEEGDNRSCSPFSGLSVDSDLLKKWMDSKPEDLPVQGLLDFVNEEQTEPCDQAHNFQQKAETNTVEVAHSSSQSSGVTNAYQPKMDSLYDQLEKVVNQAHKALSHNPEPKTERKIITEYGRRAFCAMFSDDEIKSGSVSGREVMGEKMDKFDDDKVCAIAKFLAWLISKPEEITMDGFKSFVAGLPKEKKSGLEKRNYDYFKVRILQNFANAKRTQIPKPPQAEIS